MHIGASATMHGESLAALTAGVSILLLPLSAFALGLAGMTSADGRSKVFDARANGFGRGEGIAAAFLTTHASHGNLGGPTLTGSAVQQDGKSASLVAPNGSSQRDLLLHVLGTVGGYRGGLACVEMHGTGTKLGDPIEAAALSDSVLAEGSMTLLAGGKANWGHLEPVAGASGLHKLAGALRQG